MIRKIQDEILKLKKETGAVIAAHSYQSKEILEIADYTGDSFKLSVDVSKTDADTIILCGVQFMAETAKLLSPDKKVVLAHPGADCAMARMIEPEYVRNYKAGHPGTTAVCYINTTTELKAECDVCVTSSSALKIVEQLGSGNILFVPDRNLGGYIENKTGGKFSLYDGCCPIHDSVTAEDVLKAKAEHPGALLLVHPECRPEVVELADYAGSTSGIIEYAMKSDADELIIGTEISIADYLSYRLPEKKVHILSAKLICPDMRITTLMDVYKALKGEGGKVIELDKDVAEKASRCINKMIELG